MADETDQRDVDKLSIGGRASPEIESAAHVEAKLGAPVVQNELIEAVSFLEDVSAEIGTALDLGAPNPYLMMAAHLIRSHLEAKPVTPTSLASVAGVPYATATRRLKEMVDAGMIELRPRTRTGKTFSAHPSAELLDRWQRLAGRVKRIARETFGGADEPPEEDDYFYGGSYLAAQSIKPPQVLPEPLALPGGVRLLVHGDPTFMVMKALKKQFEAVIGCKITQRAFSIDRLRAEALANAERAQSAYDIIAFDLPWLGEFVTKGVLKPLDAVMDLNRLDPSDFHTAGWRAAHWTGRPYGAPAQTTPELIFYRTDVFSEAGLEPPATIDALLRAAKALNSPSRDRYAIAWNAARGTALGHTFMMACADFGQPILNLPPVAGGFDADNLDRGDIRPNVDTERGRAAAEFLRALMPFSPPNILSMSWYERIRPYAAGTVAIAYGYTLLAPFFELDDGSPAKGRTGYLPHPHGPGARPIAPVGGYALGIPANLPEERIEPAVEALIAFTSPEAQKLYIQNGSRTNPRYSVGADPEVRRLSPIFEAIDGMSWRDELQFWPRPPIPEIAEIIQICGEEMHDMLRGVTTPQEALRAAQRRSENVMGPR